MYVCVCVRVRVRVCVRACVTVFCLCVWRVAHAKECFESAQDDDMTQFRGGVLLMRCTHFVRNHEVCVCVCVCVIHEEHSSCAPHQEHSSSQLSHVTHV